MISLKPGSVPAQAHDVEFVEEAARSNANCFWMEDNYGYGSWICVPKIDGLTGRLTSEQLDARADAQTDLHAFSSEPTAGGGRPSM